MHHIKNLLNFRRDRQISSLIYLFIYLFKSDSQFITEKKTKTKQQKLHRVRYTYKKHLKKLPRIYCK